MTIFRALLAGSILFAGGCADNADVGQPFAGTADVIAREFDRSTQHSGQRVTIPGYIWMTSNSSSERGAITMQLTTAPRGAGDGLLDFKVQLGDDADEVNLPMEETNSPTVVEERFAVDLSGAGYTDHGGTSHPLTQAVRLSGTVTYVERMDGTFSKLGPNYAWTLENVRIDTAGN